VIVMNDVVHSFVSCAKHETFGATPHLINDMMGDDGGGEDDVSVVYP